MMHPEVHEGIGGLYDQRHQLPSLGGTLLLNLDHTRVKLRRQVSSVKGI
jgi:hypothetical protein